MTVLDVVLCRNRGVVPRTMHDAKAASLLAKPMDLQQAAHGLAGGGGGGGHRAVSVCALLLLHGCMDTYGRVCVCAYNRRHIHSAIKGCPKPRRRLSALRDCSLLKAGDTLGSTHGRLFQGRVHAPQRTKWPGKGAQVGLLPAP